MLEKKLKGNRTGRRNLIQLRINGDISEDEFREQLEILRREEFSLAQLIDRPDAPSSFEPVQVFIQFRNRAVEWFGVGDAQTKRLIVSAIASNLILQDRILRISARKPFRYEVREPRVPYLRADVEDVRTLLDGEDEMIGLMKQVIERCEKKDDSEDERKAA